MVNQKNIEGIIQRLVGAIKNHGYGTTEGSYTRDIVINPISIELDGLSERLNETIDRRFSGTATGQELDVIVAEDGIDRNQAVKATGTTKITGLNGSQIKKGYLLSRSDDITYVVLEDKEISNLETSVKVECSSIGIIGNCGIGEINKFIENYPGLTGVTNEFEIMDGIDVESDENLLSRRNDRISHPATSWNQWWYRDEALKVLGVGTSHCIPRHNGAGTVKIIIANENIESTTAELITEVKKFIDDQFINDIELSVETITYKDINLVVDATLNSDFDITAAKNKIIEELQGYYKAALFKTDKIYYSYIQEVLTHSAALYNVKDLKVNNVKENIEITPNQLARTLVGNITLNGE